MGKRRGLGGVEQPASEEAMKGGRQLNGSAKTIARLFYGGATATGVPCIAGALLSPLVGLGLFALLLGGQIFFASLSFVFFPGG
jgi:hypothetical protein